MQYKIFNIDNLTKELAEKYYYMLTEKRREKITSLPQSTDRKKLLCAEMLARQCLSAEYNAPESAFSVLCNVDGVSIVGNFECDICIVSSKNIIGCAIDSHPIGISIAPIEPFSFFDAQQLCTDSEIRDIFSFSDYPMSAAIGSKKCEEKGVILRFSCYKALKEAQFKASGRAIKSSFKYAEFSYNSGFCCSSPEYEVAGCGINEKNNVTVSVIRRLK